VDNAKKSQPKSGRCNTKKITMHRIILTLLVFFSLTQTFGQTQKKVSTYLSTQYNKTIYDQTIGNNPWGIGLGLQAFYNNKSKFKPTIELTGDVYLEGDKVYRTYVDGFPLSVVDGMINLFFGSSYHPTKSIYVSVVTGPSFVGGQTLLGIKPSFGFYFSKNQRWTGKFSYINIFNRGSRTKEDFGSVSLAIGVKLF